MYEIRHLLDQFWIVRRNDKELYYEIRRALPQYRRLINDQLGWNLISNAEIIKLEKVPPRSMPWMGIEGFAELMDYCLLCALLLYLADIEDGGQFLLSSLTAAIETFVADYCPVDWTRFPHRKSLVRVLRYAQLIGLLIEHDGNSYGFSGSRDQEVLYENTGLSSHFVVHFDRDILGCRTVEDFEAFVWEGDALRGRQRICRVYRQLALAPAIYWSENDLADYEYIKNHRQWVGKYLSEALGGELQVHRNGAFFVLEDGSHFGAYHPRDLALSDAVLLLCARLRGQVAVGALERMSDDMVIITRREFRQQVAGCRAMSGNGWGRQLRELSDEKLCEMLISYMTDWMMLADHGDYLLLCPAAAKWVGHYPQNYRADNGEEAIDEPLEDA